MKKLFFTLMLMSTGAFAGNLYDYKVNRVVDGDTVEFEATFLPDPLPKKLSIRVLGVDTPEKGGRAKCEKEAKLAAAASEFTKKSVANAKKIQIELKEWDKFGGRVLGDVIIDGKSLSKELIANGHARPYFGEAKKSWCD